MRFALLLVFIAVPLLEIALLIKAGDSFGFWPTIAIVILTAILGTVMLRLQGISVMKRATDALREGKMPVEAVIDGVFLLIAGTFLLTPGLATDSIGLALLVPAVRRWIGKRAITALRNRVNFQTVNMSEERNSTATNTKAADRSRGKKSDSVVIEGSFERIDDNTKT